MKATTYIKNEIKKEMHRNGTIAKIDARKAHFVSIAKKMGFPDDQIAFAKMGADFIKIARKNAPSINKK